MNFRAWSIIRRIMGGSTAGSVTSYCRDEPIRSCPVARGWTLKATESWSDPWARLEVAQLEDLVVDEPGDGGR